MKTILKMSLIASLVIMQQTAKAQTSGNQQNGVSFVLDMQPVLQVEFISPPQINFVFDQKSKF